MRFRGVLAFLSRLPGPSLTPEELAGTAPWFPVAGIVTGLLLGLLGSAFLVLLPRLWAALAFLVGYFVVKGALHTDGLSDFADSLMAGGGTERRQAILRDPHVGVGGLIAVALFLVTVGIVVGGGPFSLPPVVRPGLGFLFEFRRWKVALETFLPFMVGVEVSANMAMVIAGHVGRPDAGSRFARAFVARKDLGGVLLAAVVTLVVTMAAWGILVALIVPWLWVGAWVASVANRKLGGVGGDALGAAHEITFAVALFFVALLPLRPLGW